MFHVTDMWNFGSVPLESLERFVLDRNVNEDDPDAEYNPERVAPDLFTLLEGI